MQAEIQIEHPKRFNNISRPIVSGGTAETLSKGNAKTKSTATKGFSVSDVTLLPVLSQPLVSEEYESDMKELARLMLAVTRKFTGSIDHWEFMPSDSLHDVVLRCTHRLRTRGNIDHIEVLRDEGNLRLILKKFIGNRSTVYFIPVRPIIELRHRNRTLFHILLSFVKSLPYGGLFPSCESRIDWLWEFLFEDMENYKDNKQIVKNHSTNFYARNRNFLEAYEMRDWKTLLDKYQPRKPIYKQIKTLLLKTGTIDFQVPFLLTVKDGYDCMFEHWESFLTVDREDSAFANGYIQMLNDCSNDYDIISAYQHTVAENGNIEPFDDGIPYRLNQLEEFINDLSELLNEL
ncbi:hypothetical protein [Costertonia aggregata]|uniref:Uncharacterized protein n=1 Tax=Costertonia aggregata TaxID=343403 RepID=A0A7H9AT00_9FLAO|nr:hypothetical protein [Costertonia aggregata]QLG46603.1 hypothetical protein HYG79_15010 [Costertonia aggregata]